MTVNENNDGSSKNTDNSCNNQYINSNFLLWTDTKVGAGKWI